MLADQISLPRKDSDTGSDELLSSAKVPNTRAPRTGSLTLRATWVAIRGLGSRSRLHGDLSPHHHNHPENPVPSPGPG